MDEMKKYINRTGKQVPFVPFEQYYPTYDSMNKYQKSWYFYWRTEVRQQHYLDTDLSYIFVHLYEILNGLGWATASDGFDQMVRLWIAYRERFPKLDNYLQEWTLEFARFHKLAYNIPEDVKDLIPIPPLSVICKLKNTAMITLR